MKKILLSGLLAIAVALSAGISTTVSAAPAPQTFSVGVHIAYPDGFVYEGVVARGIPASDLNDYLAACGQGHAWGAGSAVKFRCYAIPE